MTVIGSGNEINPNTTVDKDSLDSFGTDKSLKDIDPFGDGKQGFIQDSGDSDLQSDQSAEERDHFPIEVDLPVNIKKRTE
jgi:hypothetical protein